MITVQDHLVLPARNLVQVEQLFRDEYQTKAAQRGLLFCSAEVSPPVLVSERPINLWLRWEVTDVGAWWAMRAQSGTPEVMSFWAKIDTLVETRSRHYLSDSHPAGLPAVLPEAPQPRTRGYRETAQLNVHSDKLDTLEGILNGALPFLPGLEASALARNFAPEYAAGHLTLDLLYADDATASLAQESDVWQQQIVPALDMCCDAVHALAMETVGAGLRNADIVNGVKRTAFFRSLPDQTEDTRRRFETDLLAMPLHIEGIRNWRLSRARHVAWHRADVAAWTWVWEQEFDSLDGLTGPYMAHPHHWAYIDRWFDPESGDQAIDINLSHAFCAFEDSLLAQELLIT